MPDTSIQHPFEIGEKLRAARKQRKISLRDLAARAEVSASMLSQIENGKAIPSVRSIYSIAAALVVPVDYFFPEKSNGAVEPPSETNPGEMTASELREAIVTRPAGEVTPGFTATPQPMAVVHANARPTIQLNGGVSWARLTANAEEGVEFLEIAYAPGATSGVNMSYHEGREFGLILEGELLVELGFERFTLGEGDSLIFDSTTPHRLTNAGAKPMRATWIVFERRRNR
ncbi:MAG: cupin domain-containing protein [Chloroflexi bacterium]|nr:cupin domain-containing protein [Chloroflexota bacterium]